MIRRNPQRLAWTVLILSFCACAALAISVPLAVRSFLIDSTASADLILERQQGSVLLQRPNSLDTFAVTDRVTDLPEGSEISADQATQAVLTMRGPTATTNLVVVQLSDVTDMTLIAANSPRFDVSPSPHWLNLFVKRGRVRVNVLNDTTRPIAVTMRSPQGEVAFGAGTYIVEVTNEELQVTVREGRATVSAQGTSVVIEPSQRARVVLGQPPQGGLSDERNLIANGSFDEPLEPAWIVENDMQVITEVAGAVNSLAVAGRRAAQFERVGQSHAETRLVQEINRDVTEAVSLQLHFSYLIGGQDVPVCGSLGTECPLTVRIRYRDTDGKEREWLQGFYHLTDQGGINKPYCGTCGIPYAHRRASLLNTWFTYDSGNLMELLTVDDFKPSRIMRVTFYASGHSYRSAVTDVELLVQD